MIVTGVTLLVLTGCSTAIPVIAPAANPTGSPTPTTVSDPCHKQGVTYCVLNPDVTQTTVDQTICVRGWTSTVRPPVDYTDRLKGEQLGAEHLSGSIHDYEEDHRMPLELGGAPSDPKNLSPESPASPNPKDRDESSLKYQVCGGELSLEQAQQQMVDTWLGPYPAYKS